MDNIKHIFFDLDHTLWDFEKNSDDAYRRLLREEQIPVNFDTFIRTYNPVNRQYWEAYARGEKTKDEVKYFRLRDTFRALNVPVPEEKTRYLAEKYLTLLAQGTQLFPGAVEILACLQKNYPLHLITNGFTEVQQTKIRRSGLEQFFKTVTITEETGYLKPHPEIFRYALRKAGARADQSLMIGDNWQSDIVGAKNVGMHTIFFDPDDTFDPPEVVTVKIRHLTELKKHLLC